MLNIKPVTDQFSVVAQITPEDVAMIAAKGYGFIINNRPDHEVEGQPKASDIAIAAARYQIAYVHIPISGPANETQIVQIRDLLEKHSGDKILAFCRSGTRSITVWARAQIKAGKAFETVQSLALAAGYDLSHIKP